MIVVDSGMFDASSASSDVVRRPGRIGSTEYIREAGNGEGPDLGVLRIWRVSWMSVRGSSRVSMTRLSVE